MIAILLVHQPFFFDNYFVDFFHMYGLWGVELFLFISGFGIVYSLSKNTSRIFYIHRIKRMLPTSIIIGVLKLLFSRLGFKEDTHSNFLLLVTNLYIWYIYAITVYYLISPILFKLLKRYGLWVVLFTCVFSLLCRYIPFGNSPYYLINHIGWITGRLPIYTFTFGMYVALKPINFKISTINVVGFLFFIICLVLRAGSIMVKYKWNVPYIYILLLLATPMLCVFCSYVKRVFQKINCLVILEYLGKYSLELFLWHTYIYWNIFKNSTFDNCNSYVKALLSLCLILLLTKITIIIRDYITDRVVKHTNQ